MNESEPTESRPRNPGSRKFIAVACALGVLALCGVLIFLQPGVKKGGPQPPPPPVLVSPAESVVVPDEVEALGTVRANERVELASKVVERVTAVNFQDGQQVKAGDVLIELDDREVVAGLAEAQSALVEAERQLERVKSVQGTGAVSGADIDVERARFEAAKARVEVQEARLTERRVIAPFEGVLGLRNVSPGALVSPGDPLVTVVDTDPAKVDFTVPERYIARLLPGLAIEATSAAYPGEVFHGEVRTVDTTLDPGSRAATVRAEIPNTDGRLRPGMLLKLRLVFGNSAVTLVPESALSPVGDSVYALVVDDDGMTRQVAIVPGRRIGARVEVLEGVMPGQRVVTEGFRARAGAPVRVVEEADVFQSQQPAKSTGGG